MSDTDARRDIVTRLRDASEYRRAFGSGSGEVFDLAADEIERLRVEAREVEKYASALSELVAVIDAEPDDGESWNIRSEIALDTARALVRERVES
jgi:hypothetical protein